MLTKSQAISLIDLIKENEEKLEIFAKFLENYTDGHAVPTITIPIYEAIRIILPEDFMYELDYYLWESFPGAVVETAEGESFPVGDYNTEQFVDYLVKQGIVLDD